MKLNQPRLLSRKVVSMNQRNRNKLYGLESLILDECIRSGDVAELFSCPWE